jgi:hypothetical protein
MPGLLDRITINPAISSGKPIIHGHLLAVEYARRLVAHERAAPRISPAHDEDVRGRAILTVEADRVRVRLPGP